MKEIVVTKQDRDQRFDKFLIKYFNKAGSGFLYKMLRKKNITLNGKKSDGSERIKEGDIIQVYFSDDTFEKFKTSNIITSNNKAQANKNTSVDSNHHNKIITLDKNYDKNTSKDNQFDNSRYLKAYHQIKDVEILLELDDVIFLNKPVGVLSQASNQGDLSLNEWLIGYLISKSFMLDFGRYKPSICNRLDRNTSGIVMCAKTYLGSRILTELIRNHCLHKYYYAVVENKKDFLLSEQTTEMVGYLFKNETNNKVRVFQNEAEIPKDIEQQINKIHTKYRKIDGNEAYSLIEVELITGKSHQIRAHLASIGYPLIGDVKYGGAKVNNFNSQLLHAARIEFPALEDDEIGLSNLVIKCDLPNSFSDLVDRK